MGGVGPSPLPYQLDLSFPCLPKFCASQKHAKDTTGRVLNLSVFLAGIIHLEAEFGLRTINLVAELIAEAPSGTWWRQTLDAFA